ncbi:DUF6124 family protein [Pseudomonas rossensis]|uniref:DUF6124 family protein n=1 Tax=Pseudomonas rossensis TaxID=2305471 RepID=UPI0032602B3F
MPLSHVSLKTSRSRRQEAVKRALDFYLDPASHIKANPRKLNTMFTVDPELDIETLLGHACESLASANVMTMDLADRIEGTSRNTLLGISQVIMLAELVVSRALDRLAPSE